MQIDIVDPHEHINEASLILRAAWSPPCLRYAPEDLGWQFDQPGWCPPFAVRALNREGVPAGFVGVMPRRVRLRGRVVEIFLSSFFSVAPAFDTGSLAVALIRTEARLLRSHNRPVIIFAEPGSIGERMLRAFDAAGFVRKELGLYQVYGGVARGEEVSLIAREAADSEIPAVLELAAQRDDTRILRDHPAIAQLRHEQSDPRGRCLALVEDAAGVPVAAAVIYRSEMVGPHGPEAMAAIGALYLPQPSPEALRSLIAFAARRWAGSVTSPIVIVPNVADLDPGVLRAAGLRSTPARWAGFLFAPTPYDPLLLGDRTDLEII